MTQYYTGTVKWFDGRPGGRQWGFVSPDGARDGDEDDLLLHRDNCVPGFTPKRDQRVRFQICEDRRHNKLKAVACEPIK